MTDRQGALGVLSNGDSAERVRALEAFHSRYAHDQLVIDKWFSTQALSTRDDTFKAVVALTGHPDFTVENPNRLRDHGLEGVVRSEEHTSELQSLMRISYAVFCLKKKKKTIKNHITMY